MTTYLATAFLARFADEGVGIALALLAVERTPGHSPALGAYVLTAWLAPHALAAPLAGALAEQAGVRRLFHGCALAVFGAAIALLGLTLGRASLLLTLAVAVVGGSVGPVVTGGLSSLLALLLPAGQARTRAFALDATTYNAAAVTAPAAVSATTAAVSASLATALLAASAGGAALLSTGLRQPTDRHPPVAPGPSPNSNASLWLRAVTIGFHALWRVPQLRAITLATCVAFLGVGALPVIGVLLAQQRGEPGAGGLLMTAFAVGGLAGSLGTARWRRAPAPARLALLSLLMTASALAGAALAPQLAATVALFALAGLGDGPLLAATLRLRADHAPDGARAQVFTLGAGLKLTSAALGTALVGTLAHLPAGALTLLVAALHLAAGVLLWALGPGPWAPGALAEAAGPSAPPGR
ncbi:MFS transporter [Streptomyces oryzae]|uniref:MFS transporter n=1 Tax=Streptomyces oryzae TaxID=1434886 RepID=A0ABS3XDH2_9ACTN|nr:MFS transporter [Streptomyces oryzae]MBO8193429.1 MFS transporter [Streptomyces oryzae]